MFVCFCIYSALNAFEQKVFVDRRTIYITTFHLKPVLFVTSTGTPVHSSSVSLCNTRWLILNDSQYMHDYSQRSCTSSVPMKT